MFLNRKEIAEFLGVVPGTVSQWVKKGMPVIKIKGCDPRFDKEAVAAWFKSFQKSEVEK